MDFAELNVVGYGSLEIRNRGLASQASLDAVNSAVLEREGYPFPPSVQDLVAGPGEEELLSLLRQKQEASGIFLEAVQPALKQALEHPARPIVLLALAERVDRELGRLDDDGVHQLELESRITPLQVALLARLRHGLPPGQLWTLQLEGTLASLKSLLEDPTVKPETLQSLRQSLEDLQLTAGELHEHLRTFLVWNVRGELQWAVFGRLLAQREGESGEADRSGNASPGDRNREFIERCWANNSARDRDYAFGLLDSPLTLALRGELAKRWHDLGVLTPAEAAAPLTLASLEQMGRSAQSTGSAPSPFDPELQRAAGLALRLNLYSRAAAIRVESADNKTERLGPDSALSVVGGRLQYELPSESWLRDSPGGIVIPEMIR